MNTLLQCPYCQNELNLLATDKTGKALVCECLIQSKQSYHRFAISTSPDRQILCAFLFPQPNSFSWFWCDEEPQFFAPDQVGILTENKSPLIAKKQYIFPISDLPFELTIDNLPLLYAHLERWNQKLMTFL